MEVTPVREISLIMYRFGVEENTILMFTVSPSAICFGAITFINSTFPSDLTTNVAAIVSIKRFRMQITNFTTISRMDQVKVGEHQLE
jgi:hypothetical protein